MSDHWTNNEDLLADYVLGRVPAIRLAELESHLRECEICRRAVADEKNLAAAAKLAGRNQIKIRLRENLGQKPERTVPWPHIMSAAAVVVIIMGVGLFNGWFSTQKLETIITEEPVATRSAQANGKAELQAEQNIEPLLRKEKAASAPLSKKEQRASPLSGARKADQDAVALNEADSRVTMSDEVGKEVSAPADVIQTEMAMESAGESSSWVAGTVVQLEEKRANKSDDQGGMPAAVLRQDSPEHYRTMQRNLRRANSVSVVQQSFASLPREQQLQQSSSQSTLLAQVQRVGGKLQVILYPEHPFTEEEISKATSEFVRRDSVVITIAGQMAGYRIPENLLEPPIPSKTK